MITTKDSAQAAANIVTDVNANVELPSAPTRAVSYEAALLFNKSIVAKPLVTPEVCSLRVKNLEYQYRWVNRDGKGGHVYTQRRAQGFINATPEDVDVLGGDAVAKDGEIRAGDLVLMKIRRDIYDAHIKWNMEKADRWARTRGVRLEGASSDVMADDKPRRVSVAEEPFSRTGQATSFIPDNAEALVNDSVKSGRVDKTRAVVDELRSHKSPKVEV